MGNSETLSSGQLTALVLTERINSCFSLAGIFFILATFMFSSSFNKPINRLIFFASWGNMGSNVASLISEAGPNSVPPSGIISPLCQTQAFLVQMFLGVDCYWALCMAINVYLIFFRGYTTEYLRSWDVKYLLACYGLSAIPAFTFLFISTASHGHVYGPAIIWCWIQPKWDWMRLVFLYGIVWIAMVIALVVYGMAGKVIWSKRRHLDGFLNPLNENPFTNMVTTEIEITHEERFICKDGESGGIEMNSGMARSDNYPKLDKYSVNVQVGPQTQEARPLPAALRMRALTRDAAESETNAEAWLYARVAVLFFIALTITWVPSSVNRVYAMVRPGVVNFPLNYISSFVFPLQGLWNALIYIITSQTACRQLWNSIFSRRARRISGGTKLAEGRDSRLSTMSKR